MIHPVVVHFDNLLHLPEPVPEGWVASGLFSDEWCRLVGPRLDVPTRIGETRTLLRVRAVERPAVLLDRTVSDGPLALTIEAFRAPGESLVSACARAERAFCGCHVRRLVIESTPMGHDPIGDLWRRALERADREKS